MAACFKKRLYVCKFRNESLDYLERLIEDFKPLKISDMCDLQKLVTQGLIEEQQCGRIRTVPVSIVNASTGEKIDDCPQPHELKDLLADLWRWLDDTKDMNPFTRAFAFHFMADSIHPFVDGNGRTVRLMQHLLLLLGSQRLARFVPSETVIMRGRDRYYTAIRQSRRLEARHRKILVYAKKKNEFSIQDVVAWMPDVPRRTLERDIATLLKKRLLKAKGKSKTRIYCIAKWQT